MKSRERSFLNNAAFAVFTVVLGIAVVQKTAGSEVVCPRIDDRNSIMVGNVGRSFLVSRGQTKGGSEAETAKLVREGRLRGATPYDVLYELGGKEPITPPKQTGLALLFANPPGIGTQGPFSIELPNWELDCLLRPNVQVLLSDGSYKHFTPFWALDRASRSYGVADPNPDTFFLANSNNLIAISAERKRAKEGLDIFWLSDVDFHDVFRGLHYLALDNDFDALIAAAPDKITKFNVARAAFLSYAVWSSDIGLAYSLKYANRMLDNADGVPPETVSQAKEDVLAALLNAFTTFFRLEVVGFFSTRKKLLMLLGGFFRKSTRSAFAKRTNPWWRGLTLSHH